MHGCAIILVCSIIHLFTDVHADKNNILYNNNNDRDIWISMENFATMIEASLNVSKCTNVYLSGNSTGVENIFNQFVKIYPYEYTVMKRTYWCNGYFMIITSVEKLLKAMISVPTKISTTELLIVVDDKIDDSTRFFNVSMYENINLNIVARNGLWRLSENYLAPRIFQKIYRYEEMMHKRGIVDLQGRELQAAAFFNPPLSYLNSTINRTVNGIEGEFFIPEKKFELDGIETKLFLLLAERLNFTWSIRKPNNNYRYGRPNGTSWYGGMIGQMLRKEIDIAFTGIWLELDHYRYTNLSKPWTLLRINFLVPRPKPYTSFWALTRPLSPEVWAAVLAMIILQSAYVYTRAWTNPRVPLRFRNLAVTWTELMARLVGTSVSRKIQGLELQFQLWHLVGVLVVTAYSSSLAASLASLGYEKRIDTTKEFIEANLTWGREGPIPKFCEYFGEVDPWAMKFRTRFKHEMNEAERHEKIINGNYAIVGRIVGSTFFPENYIREEDVKNYRVMRDSVGMFYSSFAVQPWLLNSVDQVMLWLRETGLVVYHLHDVLHRRTKSVFRDVRIEHDGIEEGARVLKLTPLGAGFSMLAVGLFISTVVFYFELKFANESDRSILEILREIKKKRRLWEAEQIKLQSYQSCINLMRQRNLNQCNSMTQTNGDKSVKSKLINTARSEGRL